MPRGKAYLERRYLSGFQACLLILQTVIGFAVATEAVDSSGFRKKTGMMLVFDLAWRSQAHEQQWEDPIHQRPNDQEAKQNYGGEIEVFHRREDSKNRYSTL